VLDALAGRALFAAKLDEANSVTALHARQAIEEHAALLAAATASAGIEPGVVDTALAFAASDGEDDEQPCNALRNRWSLNGSGLKPHANPHGAASCRSTASSQSAVSCWARCWCCMHAQSDAPVQMTETAAASPVLTEADAARPMPSQDGPQRIVVQYGRNDASGAQTAQAITERLRTRGFQVAEVRPVDLRINQASVRYYFDGDRMRSQALEREVDAFVREAGLASRSELLPMRYVDPKPGRARWKSGCRLAEARARYFFCSICAFCCSAISCSRRRGRIRCGTHPRLSLRECG